MTVTVSLQRVCVCVCDRSTHASLWREGFSVHTVERAADLTGIKSADDGLCLTLICETQEANKHRPDAASTPSITGGVGADISWEKWNTTFQRRMGRLYQTAL